MSFVVKHLREGGPSVPVYFTEDGQRIGKVVNNQLVLTDTFTGSMDKKMKRCLTIVISRAKRKYGIARVVGSDGEVVNE